MEKIKQKGCFESLFEKQKSYIEFMVDKVVYGVHKSAFIHKAIFDGENIVFEVECSDRMQQRFTNESAPNLSPILKRCANAYFSGEDKESLMKKFFNLK